MGFILFVSIFYVVKFDRLLLKRVMFVGRRNVILLLWMVFLISVENYGLVVRKCFFFCMFYFIIE